MSKIHHAMMGTAAVAIGTAAAIPTLVNLAAGGGELKQYVWTSIWNITCWCQAELTNGQWVVKKPL